MFFPSRSRRGTDRFLALKTTLLLVGIALGLLGMTLDNRSIVGVAIAVVLVGFAIRLLPRGDGE